MESTCHRGTDLIEVTTEGRKCSMCGERKPPVLTGYRCRCGNEYDLEGARVPDEPVDDPSSKRLTRAAKRKQAK